MLSKTMAYIARWRMALLMIMVITMFTGCDKSNKNEFITSADSRFFPDGPSMLVREPASCSALDQKKFVHEIMSDSCLWYDTVPQSVRYNDFDSLEELLGEALHYISNNTCSSQIHAASAATPTPETELPVILKGFRRQVGVF